MEFFFFFSLKYKLIHFLWSWAQGVQGVQWRLRVDTINEECIKEALNVFKVYSNVL